MISKSLSAKIGLFAATLTLATTLAVAVSIYSSNNKLLVKNALESLTEQLLHEKIKIAEIISGANEDILFLSKLTLASGISDNCEISDQRLPERDIRAIEDIFTTFLEHNPHYVQVRLIGIGNGGKEIIKVERENKIVRRVPRANLRFKKDTEYFERTIKLNRGEVYFSDVSLNKEGYVVKIPFVPSLRVATPIFKCDSNIPLAIMIINIDMRDFFSDMERSIPRGSSLYVTNSKGDFLVNPDKTKTFGFEFGKDYKIQSLFPSISKIYNNPSSDESDEDSYAEKSDTSIIKFLKIPINKIDNKLFMGIVIAMPLKDAIAESLLIRRENLAISVILISLALLIGLWFSRIITLPIKQITEAAQKFATGDFNAELPTGYNDEVGTLAITLDEMRKQIEERNQQLSDNEQKNRVIVENMQEGIILVNGRGIIQSYNHACEMMFGYSNTDLIGENIDKIMPAFMYLIENRNKNGLKFNTNNNEVVEDGTETNGIKQDETSIPVVLSISEISVGRVTMYSGLVRDITKDKQIQENLYNYQRNLEIQNDAKSAFLANMSHEIRTPLNGIIGLTELLLKTKLNRKQLHYIDMINNSGTLLATLINDILDFSKIEAGEIDIIPEYIDLYELLKDLLEILRTRADENNIELILDYDISIPDVMMDPMRLKQVMINLIGNAIKFSKNSPVKISVRKVAENETNTTLLFEVADKGIGIPEEKQTYIFERFVQSDGSTSKKYGGTGLGLSISKSLVKLMNGEIGVNSKEGEGSTFWFKVPVLKCASSDGNVCYIDQNNSDENAAGKFNAKVLVAEDTKVNQILIEDILTDLGCKVDIAENGIYALEMYKAKFYNLIFMDCTMPEMDGYQATMAIRNHEKQTKRHIPIIAMTANAMQGDKEKCLSYGMDDYISKPTRVNDIKKKMRIYLSIDINGASNSRSPFDEEMRRRFNSENEVEEEPNS